MLSRFNLPFLFFLSVLIAGCSGSRATLATVGDEQVPLQEFEKMYAANNGGWEKAKLSSVEDRKRFLDLFINYKLKLVEARNRGLLSDTAVQNELRAYRATIASSYMLNKELIEPRLREMHRRQMVEIRASHILVRLPANATPVDTLVAYTKADQLRKMLATASFDSVAKQYSQDPSARVNNGDLGWFSQGRMVPEFEEAAYALQPGEVSRVPVRSQFGYHIIMVVARQPNKGAVRVSHVLKRFAPDFSDTAAVRDSIDLIMRRITSGEITFAQAAYLYTDDPGSKMRGGDLGFYERSAIPPDIGSILFSTNVNTIAPPYRAPYGYHIFTVTETKALPSFEEAEKDLRQQYQQMYYAKDYENYVHSLVKQYNLNFDVSLRYELSRSFDTTMTAKNEEWAHSINPEWLPRTLFSFDGTSFTVRDFVNRVNSSQEFGTEMLTPDNVDEMIERFSESAIIEHHTSRLSVRYPEFEDLMKEYVNGTLIYRIEQDEIHNKTVVTDSLLHQYYEANKKRFRWPQRMNIAEIFVRSESLAVALYERIKKGEDFGTLAEKFTERPGFKEKRGDWGFVQVKENELISMAVSMKIDSVSPPVQFESGWSIVKKLARKNAQEKTYEEALPEVTSQFREQAAKLRSEEWIESLKKKLGVKINEDVFQEAFKGKPVE